MTESVKAQSEQTVSGDRLALLVFQAIADIIGDREGVKIEVTGVSVKGEANEKPFDEKAYL